MYSFTFSCHQTAAERAVKMSYKLLYSAHPKKSPEVAKNYIVIIGMFLAFFFALSFSCVSSCVCPMKIYAFTNKSYDGTIQCNKIRIAQQYEISDAASFSGSVGCLLCMNGSEAFHWTCMYTLTYIHTHM